MPLTFLLTPHSRESTHIHIPKVVTAECTNRKGRPRKRIDAEFLRDAMGTGRNITLTQLAAKLKISRNVLRREMKLLGLGPEKFSNISVPELDQIIAAFRQQHDYRTGSQYVIGHIRDRGFRVQRCRIRASIKRVDRLGQSLRRAAQQKVVRRTYTVARPNALWHIDGYHKLIKWGIVIHGGIDGFSRMVRSSFRVPTVHADCVAKVTGLEASNNNRASTVMRMFVNACFAYGLPSRVRGDRGGENRDVAILMILLRGFHRASFMWGSSVHNSRIERLWVEVGTRFTRRWHAFFMRLEAYHHLDCHDSHHLWLLHKLFLDNINHDCHEFQRIWNAHPLPRKGHNQSPNVSNAFFHEIMS